MKRVALLWCVAAILGGCSWFDGLTMRSQSPDAPEPERPSTRLVGDLAVPTDMHMVRVDAVGLVTGLHGTGSDPAPSPQRDALLEEMQNRKVANPDSILRTGDVSLVVLQATMRPGVQKGDRFDIEVRVPSQSETTSLRGGYLLETRLSESAILGNQIHRGNLVALAQGPVLVDPSADPKKDRVLMCRGRILGGGVALKSRPLGLVLTPEHQNVMNSSKVATAVNKRFHSYQNGVKVGVAKAKTKEFIELTLHPRYKDNVARYMQVVRAVPLSESAPERTQRMASLRSKLLEPATAAQAAVELEAIGSSDGADVLLKGIQSKDPEVRFYAAEALAFLDRREAAEPLGQIARQQPAFRVFALSALSAMQDFAAYEQLRDLLSVSSAETRYGAFRALWAGNKDDALVKGESLGGQFNYHLLDVGGPSMIHATRSRIAEIVVFGTQQQFLTPLAVNAGNEIMVTSSGGSEIAVSLYSVKDGDQKRIVSTRVDDVIRAIVELGGTYPDVVQALQEAKTAGALPSRFEVDALPEAGRSYERLASGGHGENGQSAAKDGETELQAKAAPTRATPELYSSRGGADADASGSGSEKVAKKSDKDDDSQQKTDTKKGFLAKMFGR